MTSNHTFHTTLAQGASACLLNAARVACSLALVLLAFLAAPSPFPKLKIGI